MNKKNDIMADLYAEQVKLIESLGSITIYCNGNDTHINKTFSNVMPQEFEIAKQHLENMFIDLEDSWRLDVDIDNYKSTKRQVVDMEIELDNETEARLVELALKEIQNDRPALINYIVNKILVKQYNESKAEVSKRCCSASEYTNESPNECSCCSSTSVSGSSAVSYAVSSCGCGCCKPKSN